MLGTMAFAQTQTGVNFQELTFNEALAKAKTENKLIFIDCYTVWCVPCKYMTTNIFPQKEVGDYMNQKFVSVKYDMEKEEGQKLAKRFGVAVYPTFLIVNGDGTLRHRFVGSMNAEQFIEKAKEAFDDEKAGGPLEAQYAQGNRSKGFLTKYVKYLMTLSPDVANVAKELFQQLTDEEKVSRDYWFLFENDILAPYGSEFFQYLVDNWKLFTQENTAEMVEERLTFGYQNQLMKVLVGTDNSMTTADLDAMGKEMAKLQLKDNERLTAFLNIAKALSSGDQNQMLAVCEKELEHIPAENFPMEMVANVKDKATPEQAAQWEKICRKVVAKCEDKKMAEILKKHIDSIFGKE